MVKGAFSFRKKLKSLVAASANAYSKHTNDKMMVPTSYTFSHMQ